MPALPKFNSAASNSAVDTAVAASTSSPERRGGQPSMADAPFHCPPDIVLDLPVPPSVNLTRRINEAGKPLTAKWRLLAHGMLMAAGFRRRAPIPRFGLWITVSEDHTEQDLDNPLKNLIDYLRLIEVVENDAKQNMREIHVVWGEAPEGVRVTIRPLASENEKHNEPA